MNRIHLIAAATALTFAGVVPAAAKVNVIQTPSAALVRGSTFTWAPTPAIGYGVPDPKFANEVTADRLRVITDITLTNRGYYQVADPTAADLLVAYTIVIQPQSGKANTQGTLVLDLVERRTGRMVFRATSEKLITGKDVSQAKLVALLRMMTKSLPARSSKAVPHQQSSMSKAGSTRVREDDSEDQRHRVLTGISYRF